MNQEIYLKIGVVVLNENDEILLIKEKVDEESEPALNIIKGTFDKPHESIIDCAKRECLEEAGLEVEFLGVLNILTMQSRGKLKIQFNFVARANTDKVSLPKERGLHIEGENIIGESWFTNDQIADLEPKDFVADYTLRIIREWIENGKVYSLNILEDQF
ncbi:MAG: NUDIX hydrolase [Patescibacteria group bacterium]|jgi:ADP-ribose pyrophosphatase YjhB (NUDIX family)